MKKGNTKHNNDTLTMDNTREITSISSVSGATQTSNNIDNSSLLQCNALWSKMKQDAVTEQRQNRKRIDSFVKDQLFRDLKFIPSGQMMLFSTNKRSLCQLVCTALNIAPTEQQKYWDTYYRCVEKSLNTARNDSVAAVKKSFFKGKLKNYIF